MGDFSKELEGLSVEERYRAVMNHEMYSGPPTYRGQYDEYHYIPLDFCMERYGLSYIGRPVNVLVYHKNSYFQAFKQFIRFSYDKEVDGDTLKTDKWFEEITYDNEYCVLGEKQFLLVTTKTSTSFEYPNDGHRKIEIQVFDEEPDLKSGDYPKTEPYSNDRLKYKVYNYADANEIAFEDLNK